MLNTRADGEGADIGGGGYHATVGGAVQNIFISNCEIISTSTHKVAPGIGSGYGGTVHNISIRNTKYIPTKVAIANKVLIIIILANPLLLIPISIPKIEFLKLSIYLLPS